MYLWLAIRTSHALQGALYHSVFRLNHANESYIVTTPKAGIPCGMHGQPGTAVTGAAANFFSSWMIYFSTLLALRQKSSQVCALS